MKINWQPKALKQLKKLGDKKVITRILNAVKGLEYFPEVSEVKALKNHNYDYRLRVGNYRVMFNVDAVVEVVLIEEVKKRDERTY